MKEQRTITLCGEIVSYTLERKAVKNINLRLRQESGITVSAPPSAPLELVEQFLQQQSRQTDEERLKCRYARFRKF